jgi:protein gp37
VPDALDRPLSWSKSRRIFVNSMSDLFQDEVPSAFIERVFEVMRLARQHTFQILTKRAERLETVVTRLPGHLRELPNVWLGVSVEDRRYGLPRVESLRKTPAAIRFLSIEPRLEDLGPIDLAEIDWVIVGGESGPGARPMNPSWVRAIRDLCRTSGVPFFFKQWGGFSKKRTGRELDGRPRPS